MNIEHTLRGRGRGVEGELKGSERGTENKALHNLSTSPYKFNFALNEFDTIHQNIVHCN